MMKTARTEPATFGHLAHLYRWMEYLSFGPYLKQCRELRLKEMLHFRRVLVYGDGDGRFLAALVHRSPLARITAVDASDKMLRLAASRLSNAAQVQFVHANALTYRPQEPVGGQCDPHCFDLIVSHFFLDCFCESELAVLLTNVNTMTGSGAIWIVSDFAVPQSPIMRTLGTWLIGALYAAFGVLTGLTTKRLPNHGRVMQEQGWTLEDQRDLLCGLLISQRWRKT